jgi:hypothetical protein
MKPTTAIEALQEALRNGILVLKDRATEKAWNATSWAEVQSFLHPKEMFRVLMPTAENLQYVRQWHIRGSSVHEDFRFQFGKETVAGLTITVPFGVPEVEEALEEALRRAAKAKGLSVKDPAEIPSEFRRDIEKSWDIPKLIESIVEERWMPDYVDWQKKHVCVEKALQDLSWLRIDWAVFPPGTVGATDYKWACMYAFDRGTVYWGTQKPDFRELFIDSKHGLYTGRVVAIQLPKANVAKTLEDEDIEEKLGRSVWVGYVFTPREQRPYILTPRCLESGYLPPPGFSCMPKPIADRVPKELRFWEKKRVTEEDLKKAVDWAEGQKWYTRKDIWDWPESLEEILESA